MNQELFEQAEDGAIAVDIMGDRFHKQGDAWVMADATGTMLGIVPTETLADQGAFMVPRAGALGMVLIPIDPPEPAWPPLPLDPEAASWGDALNVTLLTAEALGIHVAAVGLDVDGAPLEDAPMMGVHFPENCPGNE